MDVKHKSAQISLEIDDKDTTRQEERAHLDLFRSISIGKMIAVVGSGVTTTYGYPSWAEMLRRLVDELQSMYADDIESEKMKDDLSRTPNFNSYGKKHAEKFFPEPNKKSAEVSGEDYDMTVYGTLFPLLTKNGKDRIFEKYTELFGPRMLVAKSSAQDVFPEIELPECNGDHLPQDFSHFLLSLAEFIDNLAGTGEVEINCLTRMKALHAINQSGKTRIMTDRNLIDPLDNLRSTLRIRRFATFNYDLEIESLLEDYDYPYETLTRTDELGASHRQSRLGSVARAISLSQGNASELISLAAIPADDDETVIHLHGSVNCPQDMVVSQQEYDAVYIEKHPQRNAFEDARKLMFGGNSILYVGVGMREEDVLRPLRYLASVVSERPIYALIPSLNSHEQDISLKKKIKSAYRINAITYGPGSEHIPGLAKELHVDHPLPEPFIPLHQEKRNIEGHIYSVLLHEKPAGLNVKTSPRLFHSGQPYLQALLSLPEILARHSVGRIIDKDSIDRLRKRTSIQKFFDAANSIAISIALNNAIDLIANTAKSWRRRWHIQRIDEINRHNGNGRKQKPTLQSLHAMRLEEHLEDDESKTKYLIRMTIELQSSMHVVLFNEGRGLAAFTAIANSTINPYYDDVLSKNVFCHVININHMVAANSILPIIHGAITECARSTDKNEVHVFIIHDAERMMDQNGDETQNLASLYFLYSLENLFRGKFSKQSPSIRVLLLSRRRRTSNKLCHIFGGTTPILEEFARDFRNEDLDRDNYPSTASVRERYRWPNFVIRSLKSKISQKHKKKDIFDRLESFLSSRVHSVDSKNRQSVFCGAVLDALHSHGQRLMNSEERIGLAIQHTALKWMFAIRIPVDIESILIIPEIAEIRSHYWEVLNMDDPDFSIFVDKQLYDLQYLNFIIEVSPLVYSSSDRNDNAIRYVLHEHVARYLAHKRGISIGWMDHREWNSATLCNAMMDGGPLFSEEDYRNSCEIYETFTRSGLRRPLQCAYAIIRGHLYAPNALRAGLMYSHGGDERPVIDNHVGRLSRLRSAATKLKLNNGAPSYFEHFEVWITNEIGVMKFIQGDFHDAVMLFRECLDFLEREKSSAGFMLSDNAYQDPALVIRIRINLAMSLIERAHFEQATKLIASTITKLNEIGSAAGREDSSESDNHETDERISDIHDAPQWLRKIHKREVEFYEQPECKLLRALSLGCQAQIELLTADLDKARESIDEAIREHAKKIDLMGVIGWLYGLSAQIASASGNDVTAGMHWKKALAAARGSRRPDFILSLEIAETEFQIRHCNGNRAIVLSALSTLTQLEKTAHALGSHKAKVGILLIRARALLFLEQTESARESIIDAICLSLLNGMRLKRVSALILMVALMAMRGEREAAQKLLKTVKLSATRYRYVRASIDIDRLEREIEMDGSVAAWAGYLSEFPTS
jgi:hypothetical protein